MSERLQERLAVVESQLADIKKAKEESDKRGANFIDAGIGIALGVVGNLIVAAFRRP